MISIIARLIASGHIDLAEALDTEGISYPGNIGFEEMMNFWDKADSKEINLMKKIIDKKDWGSFKKLIKKVLEVVMV